MNEMVATMINQSDKAGSQKEYHTYKTQVNRWFSTFEKRFAKDIERLLLPCF